MKRNLYPRLAWTGIRKNRRLYLPYLLTCIGMVTMFYIVSFLAENEYLAGCRGGSNMQEMLRLGSYVVGIFAAIFLFYTNSFLMRRRKKEFGLYNILGMGKWNLAGVLLWESLMLAGFALGAGLSGGILLSKAAELAMVNILEAEIDFKMSVGYPSIVRTILLFLVIFALILANGLRQLHRTNPIGLLHSENAGEKPPRVNWLFAAAGAALLFGAYGLAVAIKNPLEAMLWFFVAVIMVIAATYLLFLSGSVAICRLLQRNKRYYYRTSHFVSVSSMAYRMRRNGAGLASICILCTMVLVTVSSTVCLYVGREGVLRKRYPGNIEVTVWAEGTEQLSADRARLKEIVGQVLAEHGVEAGEVFDYRAAYLSVCEKDGVLDAGDPGAFNFTGDYAHIWQVFLVPVGDYNRLMGKEVELEPDEVLIYSTKQEYSGDRISFLGGKKFRVKGVAEEFSGEGAAVLQVIPAVYLFVADFEQELAPVLQYADFNGNRAARLEWKYAFDLDCGSEEQIRIQEELRSAIRAEGLSRAEAGGENGRFQATVDGVARERADFNAVYGGLFFLGVLLGTIFVFAAVLIMYYKQISEGYEDQARFEIMQKVGMTKREIQKSVNSQVMTVFFLPLAAAGLHLAFAFPMIRKILLLFGLVDGRLPAVTTVVCFGVFALMYVAVYRVTSRSYYLIVSGHGGQE